MIAPRSLAPPHGQKANSDTTKPKDYGKGRVCEVDDCKTILCRYDRGPTCWACAPLRKPRMRAA